MRISGWSSDVCSSDLSGEGGTAVGGTGGATGAQSTALGQFAWATRDGATALGQDTFANAEGATAIGASAWSNGENSVALGSGSRASDANVVSVGNGTGNGGYPATRRITNVSDGIDDNDAVNVAQLQEVAKTADNTDHFFQASDDPDNPGV